MRLRYQRSKRSRMAMWGPPVGDGVHPDRHGARSDGPVLVPGAGRARAVLVRRARGRAPALPVCRRGGPRAGSTSAASARNRGRPLGAVGRRLDALQALRALRWLSAQTKAWAAFTSASSHASRHGPCSACRRAKRSTTRTARASFAREVSSGSHCARSGMARCMRRDRDRRRRADQASRGHGVRDLRLCRQPDRGFPPSFLAASSRFVSHVLRRQRGPGGAGGADGPLSRNAGGFDGHGAPHATTPRPTSLPSGTGIRSAVRPTATGHTLGVARDGVQGGARPRSGVRPGATDPCFLARPPHPDLCRRLLPRVEARPART